jgi:hypothetical protein
MRNFNNLGAFGPIDWLTQNSMPNCEVQGDRKIRWWEMWIKIGCITAPLSRKVKVQLMTLRRVPFALTQKAPGSGASVCVVVESSVHDQADNAPTQELFECQSRCRRRRYHRYRDQHFHRVSFHFLWGKRNIECWIIQVFWRSSPGVKHIYHK